ncbi:hypothetical protein D3C84_777050 [compost metagenome]
MLMAGAMLVGAAALLAAGEPEQALMTKVMTKAHRRQRVQFAGRRQRQQMPQPDQVQVRVSMLRCRIAEVRRQALHARRADVFPARVCQQHATAQLLQGLAQGSRRSVGTDDEEAAGRRFGDFQQARQWPCRGALQHHGANDHSESQGHKQQGTLMAGLIQANREYRRHGRCDDPARGYPR